MESRRNLKLSGKNAVKIGAFITLSCSHSLAQSDDIRDTSVCYAAPGVALNMNIKIHSLLRNRINAAKSGQTVQTAYSVHGKFVNQLIAPGKVFMADGTLIVGSAPKNSNAPSGAHLGVDIHAATDNPAQAVVLDCTSDQVAPTPDSWACAIRLSDGSTSQGDLVRVDYLGNTNCGLFQ